MRERILVTSMTGSAELLRSMALRGRNTFALRVMGAEQLAETALIRCGRLPGERRLFADEQRFVVARLMREISWFSGACSLQDAGNLASSLDAMRLRLTGEEAAELHSRLAGGEFADKNAALLQLYDRYAAYLRDECRIDGIGLMRYALANAEPLDADFLTLAEDVLSPLERALAERLSSGNAAATTVTELLGARPNGELRLDSLTEAYGAVNEVDALIGDLYTRAVPLDECVVAVTDTARYSALFHDLSTQYGIPTAMGCGVPIAGTRPAVLLQLWNTWHTTGFHGRDALADMLFSDAFDRAALRQDLTADSPEETVPLRRLAQLAGSLRLCPDAAVNERRVLAWEETLDEASEDRELAPRLAALGRALSRPCADFIARYTSLRRDGRAAPLDAAARTAILNVLSQADRFPGTVTAEELIPEALAQAVGVEQACGGKLYVNSIEGALAVQRKHLYVLGLSADAFPGKPRENALVLDSDWQLLPDPETAPTSYALVERRRERLMTLVRTASALDIDVHLSWPDYDIAALKDLTPSSAVYTFRSLFPDVETRKVPYFPAPLSPAEAAGRLYLDGAVYLPEPQEGQDLTFLRVDPKLRGWSPSAIDTWFACKRQFLYAYILRLTPAEPDDPMQVIPANDYGTLAHALMECLAREKPDRQTFRGMAERAFDAYLTARPPIDPHSAARIRDRFVQMMDGAWEDDPRRETLMTEDALKCEHPSGMTLIGRPDRVERDEAGRGVVVDFKTGYQIRHVQDDHATCRQTLLYAWMLSQRGIPIDRCEYRYLRRRAVVACSADAEHMLALDADLALFREGLETGNFIAADGYGGEVDPEVCKYCAYFALCRSGREETP